MSLLRPRLALRIYLVGLVQFGLVLLGFALLMWTHRATARNLEGDARAAVQRIVASLGDEGALARELERVDEVLDASIIVYDGSGKVLATNRRGNDIEPPAFTEGPRLFRARGQGPMRAPFAGAPAAIGFGGPPVLPPVGPPMLAFLMPVELSDGPGRVFFAARNARAPFNGYLVVGFVLVVVGLASFITARSLAKPLTRLSAAAQSFGAGELETRVRLQRADEIGEVARAFDDMAERIAHLVRAEKELMANVSHELRTPLARIRVALDLAAEGDASVARQSLREIAEDLGELEQLISDVLVASRLDLARLGSSPATSGFPLHKEHVAISDLVEKTVVRFRAAHPGRPLDVEMVQDATSVDGDPVLLRRALENLLENAHKYTIDPNASIRLESGVDASFVWIEVRDPGIGIAADDLRHVFLPFFRSDKSRTRATGGFGLGLSIVKQIAEAHQGSVELASQIGAGTRVRIRLPSDDKPV
jgi:two-component system, OmpR family, sensor kinase